MTDSGAQLVSGQIGCPECKKKRFFVYLIKGMVQVVCAKCGSRTNDLAGEVPAP